MKSFVFRVAGGPEVGFGHLRRSWTLASRLVREGAAVHFVATSREGTEVLRRTGFAVSTEPHTDQLVETIRILRGGSGLDICVVDDPAVPREALATLQELVPVVCIDDTCERVFPVDLVVNGTAGAENLLFRGAERTRYLLGTNYILLRPAFAEPPARPAPAARIRRVLVLTGGGDAGALPCVVVGVVRAALPDAHIDVVSGPFGKSSVFDGPSGAHVRVHRNPRDVRALMLAVDLAVSAGGQTLYELAATSTPTIGVKIVENQTLNLAGLAKAGCLWDLGSGADGEFAARLGEALVALDRDPATRRAMAEAGRRAVDGRGAERVAAELGAIV